MENKKRINIIDVIFILLLVGLIVFGITGISDVKQAVRGNDVTKVVYTVEIQNQDSEILKYMKNGDRVFEDESMKRMGTVVNISEAPYKILTENKVENIVTQQEVPDKITVYVDISTEGVVSSDNVVSVDSVNLLVGKTIDLNIGNSYVEGVIVDIHDVNEAKEAQK